MAEVALRVAQPIITFNAVVLDDPRSFGITRASVSQYADGRPGDAWNTTVQVHRSSYGFTFTIGDELEARTLVVTPTADAAFVGTSVGVHGEANLIYTIAKATISDFPRLGSSQNEARTFTFGGVGRSTDGSTSPLAVS